MQDRPMVRDLTSGNISKNLWFLAVPMMATNMLQTLFNVADMIFVGKIGAAAIAAVSVCGAIMMLPMAALLGVAAATVAMVSRFFGAQDYEGASNAAIQSLLMGVIGGVIILAIGIQFAPQLLGVFGIQEKVLILATSYLRIIFYATIALALQFLTASILQAVGDASTAFWIVASSVVLNVGLDPLLIFGIGPFPRLEVAGAAWATSFSRTMGMVLALIILFRKRTHIRLYLHDIHFDFALMKRMLAIGIPGSIQMAIRSIAGMILMSIVAHYGTFAVATYGIGLRLDMFVLMPGFGLGAATATLVGQNLGAYKIKRAEISGWIAAGYYFAFMIFAAVIFYIFAETVIVIFNNQEEVMTLGKQFLRIVVFAYPFLAFAVIMNRALSGAGETKITMFVTSFTLIGVMIPLALILPKVFEIDTTGLWLAIAAANMAQGTIMTIIFARGRWKSKTI